MLRIEDQIENSTAMIKTVDYIESQIRKINSDEGTADAFVAEAKAAIERLRAIMKEGKIIEQGTHEELLAQGGFYHMLYNSQFTS